MLYASGENAIQAIAMDWESGELMALGDPIEHEFAGNFLTTSPGFLYACHKGGAVAFRVTGGSLALINSVRTEIAGNVHVELGKGMLMMAADGGGVNLARVLSDGSLMEAP